MYANGQGSMGGATSGPPMGWAPSLADKSSTANDLTATDRIRAELEGAVNRVHGAIERVRHFTSAAIGEGSAHGLNAKEAPNRPGRIGAIQDRVDQLHASLSVLEGELERLTQI